jgi:hypothetical protein
LRIAVKRVSVGCMTASFPGGGCSGTLARIGPELLLLGPLLAAARRLRS